MSNLSIEYIVQKITDKTGSRPLVESRKISVPINPQIIVKLKEKSGISFSAIGKPGSPMVSIVPCTISEIPLSPESVYDANDKDFDPIDDSQQQVHCSVSKIRKSRKKLLVATNPEPQTVNEFMESEKVKTHDSEGLLDILKEGKITNSTSFRAEEEVVNGFNSIFLELVQSAAHLKETETNLKQKKLDESDEIIDGDQCSHSSVEHFGADDITNDTTVPMKSISYLNINKADFNTSSYLELPSELRNDALNCITDKSAHENESSDILERSQVYHHFLSLIKVNANK